MPAPTVLSVSQLVRLVGLPDAPGLIDVRIDEDLALSECSRAPLAGTFARFTAWAADYAVQKHVVTICQRGGKLSQGVAAWLRHSGINAETLKGGFEAWAAVGAPPVRPDKVPPPVN